MSALSTEKQGYIRRLPWDKTPSVMVAGVYWEWMVNKGRKDGRDLGSGLYGSALRGTCRRAREKPWRAWDHLSIMILITIAFRK